MYPLNNKYGYEQTVVTAPQAPSAATAPMDMTVMAPIIRDIFADTIIDEPRLRQDFTSARSIFRGNALIDFGALQRDIKYGQVVNVPVFKDQNPLSLYQRTDLQYTDTDPCHEQLDLHCGMPCISTNPVIEVLQVRFNHEYAYGVRACDQNKDFWDFDFFTRQYALSKGGYEFGRERDMWNTVIQAAIAAPATTTDVAIQAAHPTHFWDNLGDIAAYGRDEIMTAYQYHVNAYDVDDVIVMTYEAANTLIRSVENPFNINLTTQRVNTFEQWFIPGYDVADGVADILGVPAGKVVVMKRSNWLAGEGFNTFPLWNADMSKQYVVIMDPRVGYDYSVDGYHLNIMPYDCDKVVRGMIDTEYVAMGITFPQYIVVLEFDSGITRPIAAESVALDEEELSINAGETGTLTATVTPDGATTSVTAKSSDPRVAAVAVAGDTITVTGVTEGEATITVSAGPGVTATATVTVAAAA